MKNQQKKGEYNQKTQQKEELVIEFGYCIFKKPIPIRQLTQQLINFCNQQTINFSSTNYWNQQYIHLISQFKLPKLILKNDTQCKIIKQILPIKFNHLISLNLQKNNISNIEFIEQLQCPKLNYLLLDNNNISNIKPVAKIRFNYILYVSLSCNNISQIQHPERITINKFANLMLKQKKSNSNKKYPIQQQDDSYLAKFQSTFYKNQHWPANVTQKIIQRKIWDILYYKDLKKLQKEIPANTTTYFPAIRNQ